jgi:hypothetical protein
LFEITTKTRPVMGSACAEAGKETLNLRSDDAVLGQALEGGPSAAKTAMATTAAEKQ